jgi:biopolymer transport protein ExbD
MRWRADTQEPTPSMPVAPMLDMAFQILAFFILIYHPASSERAVAVHASEPTGDASQTKGAVKPVIGIDIVAGFLPGQAAAYRLHNKDFKSRPILNLESLRAQLKSCQTGTTIRITAQAGIPMGDVVAAVDAAAAAGLTTITFGEPAAPRPMRR